LGSSSDSPADSSATHLACKAPAILQDILARFDSLEQKVRPIAEHSEKAAHEVHEMRKTYQNEFATQLKSMDQQLDKYRKIDDGRAFDDILRDVAKLYSDYESLAEEIENESAKEKFRFMLEDMFNVLDAYGVRMQKSKPGDKRTRYCQIAGRVQANTPELHDTVEESRYTGFHVDNRPLVKELVVVRLFANQNAEKTADSSN